MAECVREPARVDRILREKGVVVVMGVRPCQGTGECSKHGQGDI